MFWSCCIKFSSSFISLRLSFFFLFFLQNCQHSHYFSYLFLLPFQPGSEIFCSGLGFRKIIDFKMEKRAVCDQAKEKGLCGTLKHRGCMCPSTYNLGYAWPPSCVTPSPSSCERTHEQFIVSNDYHEKVNSWISFSFLPISVWSSSWRPFGSPELRSKSASVLL